MVSSECSPFDIMIKTLLPMRDWWIGKLPDGDPEAPLLAVMFVNDRNEVIWEVLDESNLPVDLVRCNGKEYSFILPVSLDGHAIIKEVGASLRTAAPEISLYSCSVTTGTPANCDSVLLGSGVCCNEMTDDRPIGGVVIHSISNLSGILTSNADVCAPTLKPEHEK